MQLSGDIDLIRDIERMAAHAWPALQTQALAGWRLRYSYGVTRRANSVWPNELAERRGDNPSGASGLNLDGQISQVEAYYAARALPARFQMCPAALPVALDAALAARGYAAVAETAVMIAPVASVLAALTRADGAWHVTVQAAVDNAWLALYAAVEDVPTREVGIRREIMRSIQPSAAYATVWAGTEAVAVGSAVCTGAYAGLFNLGTLPGWRRRGAAQAAMASLLDWARSEGADQSYLQVMTRNEAAQSLYTRLGYSTLYHYVYREQPQPAG